MSIDGDAPLSRRQWLEHVSVPAAASLGAASLGVSTVGAQRAPARAPNDHGARVYNVRDFGAKGDGTTLDTAALQAAIDACTRDRGGVVLVPAGDFLTGTFELKSNVTLRIAAQGRILGTADPAQYRAGNGVPPGNGNIVLLSATNAENVTIEGEGTIDGQGKKFFTGKGDGTGPGGNFQTSYYQRPHLIVFYKVKNLRVRDVFLTASAYHCTRILDCENVILDGVRIYNRVNLNNDGFHINSSRYVHIVNCDIQCQDDACALFGSNKWVTVTNCTFSTRWSIFRFGGGQAENITISNCVINDTFGAVVKMRCGGNSRFENISFSNLIMRNVTGPISIGLDSTRRNPSNSPNAPPPAKGIVRNIAFNGIRAFVVATPRQYPDMAWPQNYRPGEFKSCIVLNGVGDEMLEEISFTDVHCTYEGGGTLAEGAVRDVPKLAGEYFELGILPAYAMYARNVRGLSLHNVRFRIESPDLRPAIIMDHVVDATLNGVSAQGNPQAEAVMRLIESRDVLVTAPRVLTPAAAFLHVEGATTEGIRVDGGDIGRAAKPATFAAGAKTGAVVVRG
ncbi:MAG: glycoside hydrolase family 28 protein [Gemmatimonadaceae bacterium]